MADLMVDHISERVSLDEIRSRVYFHPEDEAYLEKILPTLGTE